MGKLIRFGGLALILAGAVLPFTLSSEKENVARILVGPNYSSPAVRERCVVARRNHFDRRVDKIQNYLGGSNESFSISTSETIHNLSIIFDSLAGASWRIDSNDSDFNRGSVLFSNGFSGSYVSDKDSVHIDSSHFSIDIMFRLDNLGERSFRKAVASYPSPFFPGRHDALEIREGVRLTDSLAQDYKVRRGFMAESAFFNSKIIFSPLGEEALFIPKSISSKGYFSNLASAIPFR